MSVVLPEDQNFDLLNSVGVFTINLPCWVQSNAVAYDEGHGVELEKKLFLGDAVSDLPPVCISCLCILCNII